MLLLFVLQHSLMATDCWKSLLSTLHLKVVERPIYVIATAYALQVGMIGSAQGSTLYKLIYFAKRVQGVY